MSGLRSDAALIASELAGPPGPLSLVALARVVGGLRYVELAGFETLGRLATGGGLAPRLAVWASSASLAHAWRADQLEPLCPVSAGLASAEECTVSPGVEVDSFVDELAPDTALAWYSVLSGAYERLVEAAHPSADEAMARTLRRLLADISFIAAELV